MGTPDAAYHAWVPISVVGKRMVTNWRLPSAGINCRLNVSKQFNQHLREQKRYHTFQQSKLNLKVTSKLGRDGGLVVSVLAFYSNDLSSIPADNLNFLYKTTKINEKEAGVGPLLLKFPN